MTKHRRHKIDTNERFNWLKAAVLGSNDGIISIAGLVIGVSEATHLKEAVLTSGVVGIIAGALSIAAGEYLSVSSQRDTENALLAKEKIAIKKFPKEELNDLVSSYRDDGMDLRTARKAAQESTEYNALLTHAEVDLHIDPRHLTSPWSSVFTSAGSFTMGAIIPLAFAILPSYEFAIPSIFCSVIVALSITGFVSAKFSGISAYKSIMRVVIVGTIAMATTYLLGRLFKTSGI